MYATRADYRQSVKDKLGEAIYGASECAALLTLASVATNVTEEDIELPEDVVEWMESFARQVHEQGISAGPSLRLWDILWREPTVPQTFEEAFRKLMTDYGLEVASFNTKAPTPLTFEAEFGVLLEKYGLRYGQINVRAGELTKCTLRQSVNG